MKIRDIDTPALIIDKEKMLANIQYMQDYADRHKVSLRPHTKTHKMPELAKLTEKYGAKGIAVAKVGEAEVMAEAGLKDIFIANEIVGNIKWERIRKLAETIDISFGVDSPCQIESVEKVFANEAKPAEVLIEIEVGENRSGIIMEQDFIKLLDTINACPHVHLKGVFSHDGNTYGAQDIMECFELAVGAQKRTIYFANIARKLGFECPVVSYGSTPTFMNDVPIMEGITELRPGTYIFMDVGQGNAIGTYDRCAATVLATVISKPTKGRTIMDAGAKALTKETRVGGICNTNGMGVIYEHQDISVTKLYDEHTIILNKDFCSMVEIGDKLRIIPVHICPVCNLYDEAYLVSGDEVVDILKVAGRGKIQ